MANLTRLSKFPLLYPYRLAKWILSHHRPHSSSGWASANMSSPRWLNEHGQMAWPGVESFTQTILCDAF